jgi:hypothetical protein
MWEAHEQKNQIIGLEYAAIFPGYNYGTFEVLKISAGTQQPGFKFPFWVHLESFVIEVFYLRRRRRKRRNKGLIAGPCKSLLGGTSSGG